MPIQADIVHQKNTIDTFIVHITHFLTGIEDKLYFYINFEKIEVPKLAWKNRKMAQKCTDH